MTRSHQEKLWTKKMMTYKLLESHIYCILLDISNSKKNDNKKSRSKTPTTNNHVDLGDGTISKSPRSAAQCSGIMPSLSPCPRRAAMSFSAAPPKKKTVGSFRIRTKQKDFNKIWVPRNKLSIHGEGCCLAILGGGLSWYQSGPWKMWKRPISFGKAPLEPHQGLKKHEHPTRFSNS